jgi:phosphoglycerate dehydrogenase-like enzyme
MHAGCDELDFATLKSRRVTLANIRGANAVAVAEHAIALLLGTSKRLPQSRDAVLSSRMAAYYAPGQHSALLAGRTVGLVGLGEVGTAIATRLQAFDMTVIATRRHPERSSGDVRATYGPDALHEMLRLSDYVVLAAPLTKDTLGLFDRTAFAAMRPGAFLVNIARGNLVQEAALAGALESGRLAGYRSDVWWFYDNAYPASYHFPVPSRTGIHLQSNVLGTGGQASNAAGVVEASIAMAADNVSDFVNQRPLPGKVDLDLEY